MGTEKSKNTVAIVSLLMVFALAVPDAGHSDEGLTAESCWRLTIALLQDQVNGWQEKMALLEEHGEDPFLFVLLEEKVMLAEQATRDSLYSVYSTNPVQYRRFARTHAPQIKEYLLENPEIREQIEDLKALNESLIEQYETLLSQYNIRGEE